MATVPTHLVEFRSEDNQLKFRCLYGQDPPELSGGVGGWEAVNRPGRRPLMVWRGVQEPLKLTISLLFDKFDKTSRERGGESVEAECRMLERMGGLDRGDPEPPKLIIEGALPHDESRSKQNRWVIESLEWGDAIRRVSDGHRVRQAVKATLSQHVEDDRLSRAKRSKKPGTRFVRAKKGDTFEKIAKRELKNAKWGRRLAGFNGKRSPDSKIKEGTQVRVPTGETLKEWQKGK